MNDYKWDHMTMIDVCLLLDLTPGEVRKHCREGRIKSIKREQSIHRDIPTDQFREHPQWETFLEKIEERKQRKLEFIHVVKKISNEWA